MQKEISIYARQGDLLLNPVEEVPVSLEKTKQTVTIKGSHDGAHTLPPGVFYGKMDEHQFVRPEKDVELTHAGRHRPVPLKAGQTYKIWSQIERHGKGDKEVED